MEVDTLTEEQKHCPVCQSQMIPIGHEEIRIELRYTRAKLERVVYIATTYGCRPVKIQKILSLSNVLGTP